MVTVKEERSMNRGKVALSVLLIEVTNRCNLNCPHCFFYENGEKGTNFNDFISEKTIDRIFSDSIGIKAITTLNFTGGEPLLAEEKIIYTLNKIMEEHIIVLGVDIATNGTILSDKFAEKLNEFSLYMRDYIKNHEKLQDIFELITNKDKITTQLRISNSYHDNNPQKAYDFYSKRMPNVITKIIEENGIEKENRAKRVSLKSTSENILSISYSGRAKSLKSNFYCDSPHHKIVYKNKTKTNVKCPIKVNCKGDFSINAICSHKTEKENAFGNVFENRSLKEMISDWNYKTPLTCDEACDIETLKMAYETNRLNELSEMFECSIEDIKETMDNKFTIYTFIENYRRTLHEKEPTLTPEEIEQASNYWFEIEKAKANEKSDKEIEERNNIYIDYLTQCVYEHYFDGVKEVHKEFPYLSSDECREMKEYYRICTEEKGCNLYYYAAKAQRLMMINESRLRNAIIEGHDNAKKERKIK